MLLQPIVLRIKLQPYSLCCCTKLILKFVLLQPIVMPTSKGGEMKGREGMEGEGLGRGEGKRGEEGVPEREGEERGPP